MRLFASLCLLIVWAVGPLRAEQYRVMAPADPAARAVPKGLTGAALERALFPTYGVPSRPAYTPVPTRVATPPPPQVALVYVGRRFQPKWMAELHLGAGMPLGALANENSLGFTGQFLGGCQVSEDVVVQAFGLLSSLPAAIQLPDGQVQTGSPVGTNVMALGARGLWTVARVQEMELYVGAGLGLAQGTRNKQVLTSGNSYPITWAASTASVGGLLYVVCVGTTYNLLRDLDFIAEVEWMGLSLSGGTGDLSQIGAPSVGARYTFN